MQYSLKLSSTSQNPAYSGVFNGKFKSAFDRKPNQIPPLGNRVEPDLHAIGFKLKDIVQSSISVTPPWLLDHPRVNLDLRCFHKEDTPPEIYRSRFHEICFHYDGFHRLYTDGSKIGDQVASAAIARNRSKMVRLPDKSSERNYTQLLLPWISFVTAKTLNLSSFLIPCQTLKPSLFFKIEVDLVLKIIKDYTSLMKAGKVIEFWIPSHLYVYVNAACKNLKHIHVPTSHVLSSIVNVTRP